MKKYLRGDVGVTPQNTFAQYETVRVFGAQLASCVRPLMPFAGNLDPAGRATPLAGCQLHTTFRWPCFLALAGAKPELGSTLEGAGLDRSSGADVHGRLVGLQGGMVGHAHDERVTTLAEPLFTWHWPVGSCSCRSFSRHRPAPLFSAKYQPSPAAGPRPGPRTHRSAWSTCRS